MTIKVFAVISVCWLNKRYLSSCANGSAKKIFSRSIWMSVVCLDRRNRNAFSQSTWIARLLRSSFDHWSMLFVRCSSSLHVCTNGVLFCSREESLQRDVAQHSDHRSRWRSTNDDHQTYSKRIVSSFALLHLLGWMRSKSPLVCLRCWSSCRWLRFRPIVSMSFWFLPMNFFFPDWTVTVETRIRSYWLSIRFSRSFVSLVSFNWSNSNINVFDSSAIISKKFVPFRIWTCWIVCSLI